MAKAKTQTQIETAPPADPIPLLEEVARILCASRGANPDEPITIGNPDGSFRQFDVAWEGYTETADAVIAAVKSRSS